MSFEGRITHLFHYIYLYIKESAAPYDFDIPNGSLLENAEFTSLHGFLNSVRLDILCAFLYLVFEFSIWDCCNERLRTDQNNSWRLSKCRCTPHLQMLQGMIYQSFVLYKSVICLHSECFQVLRISGCLRLQESTIYFFEWSLHGTWFPAYYCTSTALYTTICQSLAKLPRLLGIKSEYTNNN